MDSSWYNRNGLNNNNQNTNKPVSADDPISFMIDLMVSMFTAFAEGVKKGYGKGGNANEKGASATDLQAQQMEQMQNMMQQMMQMFQGMQMMQAQMMGMQRNSPAGVVQKEAQAEAAKEPGKKEGDLEKAPEEAENKAKEPEKIAKEAENKAEEPEKIAEEPEKKAGEAAVEEQAQKDAVVPEEPLPEKASEKPMKWYSDAEMEKAIKALENMKNEKGKLSYTADRYLKSVKELKSATEKEPDGAHVGLYVKVYKGAVNFMSDSAESSPEDKSVQEARDIARTMRRRLNENKRIDKLESIDRLQKKQMKAQAKKEEPAKAEAKEIKAEEPAKQKQEVKKEELKKKAPEKTESREKKIEAAKEKRAEKRLEEKKMKQLSPQKAVMGK